jgi:hypothetical protein
MNLRNLPAFEKLDSASAVVIAGAGGGYDIFCGLPLYFHLREAGKKVFLANLTFSNLAGFEGARLAETIAEVDAHTSGSLSSSPERLLSKWLLDSGIQQSVFCIEKNGVVPVAKAYRAIIDLTAADALVLADGGSDSLLIGDEPDLGTPTEDAISLIATAELDLPLTLLVTLGFGTDTRHGVCHAHVLESVSTLLKTGSFLGAVSLTSAMPEVQRYAEATRSVCETADQQSYVNSAVLSALEGRFGLDATGSASSDPPAWINPLLLFYWFFDLRAVASRLLYGPHIRNTHTALEVTRIIEGFRKNIPIRSREDIPI